MENMNAYEKHNDRLILAVYALMAVFFILKTVFYIDNVGQTPDEAAHIAYIVYETENMVSYVPEFEQIAQSYYYDSTDETGDIFVAADSGGQANYLGHPPLYYKLMALCGMVTIIENGESAYVNINGLRYINLILVLIGVSVFFYIGYCTITHKKEYILVHLLYAAICCGVPMIAFEAGGCSNDNLLYLGFGLFLLGIIRYFEDRLDFKTYFLVAIGTFICIMTKLTAGLVVAVMIVLIFCIDTVWHRYVRILAKKEFWCSMPIYLAAMCYYILLYHKYGVIQVSMELLTPEAYYQSSWYIPQKDRVVLSLYEFIIYFKDELLRTWASAYSGEKNFWNMAWSLPWRVFCFILVLAVAGFCVALYKIIKKTDFQKYIVWITGGIAMAVMLIVHFNSCYSSYLKSGRVGGAQGRYYLFAVPVLAFWNASVFDRLLQKNKSRIYRVAVESVVTLYVFLLIFSDLLAHW